MLYVRGKAASTALIARLASLRSQSQSQIQTRNLCHHLTPSAVQTLLLSPAPCTHPFRRHRKSTKGMASTGQSISQGRHAVEARIKTLLNNDLKEICRGENLAVSGVKAQLQTRILRRTWLCLLLLQSYHARRFAFHPSANTRPLLIRLPNHRSGGYNQEW